MTKHQREIMPDMHPGGGPISDETGPLERTFHVFVTNATDAAIDVSRIEAAAKLAFADAPYADVALSVAIVDDDSIHELNRQYLEHDYPTDVLSFPLEDAPPRLEGEIVVSVDTANRCAAEAGWSGAEELLLYVVHGALHLAGYRDKDPADAAEMRAHEAAVLAKLGVKTGAADARWHASGEEAESP